MKKILIISDNISVFRKCIPIFRAIAKRYIIDYGKTIADSNLSLDDRQLFDFEKDKTKLASNYDLIISLHCKSLFPADLVSSIRCVNIHPGFNPYNRGWYPHVFSLINGLPAGVTIHEMDNEIDNGNVIVQEQVSIFEHDTSETLYERIIDKEVELIEKNIVRVVENDYQSFTPRDKGNINYRRDYEDLCKIDLDEKCSFSEFKNRLRALSHEHYRNAYFLGEDGKKIYMKLSLESGENET